MKKVLFIVLSASALFSCKKHKKDNDVVTCTTTATSIAGSYKITAMTYKSSSTATEENYLPIIFPDACQRDDVYSFNVNGTYQITDAGIVCSPSGNESGTWAISGNTMTIDGDPTTIQSFDCKTLVIINTDIMETGDILRITQTRQ